MYASERLSSTCIGKASRGKAKVKTGIGKSDFPGLQGGPRKRDYGLFGRSARASALSRPRSQSSRETGSECCHSPGDWWVRSVHSKEAGREDSAPKTRLVAMPTPLTRRKAASGRPICEVAPGSPESLARGMLPKGFPRNPGELPHLLLTMGGTDRQGKPEATGIDGRAVL